MLNFQIFNENALAPVLLIAHGLYGSGRNWGVIAKRLSDERTVITVDMRNHGQSAWQDSHTYADLAADLAEVCLLYTSPSPRDLSTSRMPSSA